MKNIYLVLISLGVAVLVAGCGGGGTTAAAPAGGGTPTGTVQITATNGGAVAKGGMTPSQTMAKTGSGGAAAVGVVVQPTPPKKSVLQVALSQLRLMEGKQFPAAPAGVIGVSVSPYFPVSVGCGPYSNTMSFATPLPGVPNTLNPASGVMAIDLIDNNTNGKFDLGDTASVTATNCVDTNPAAVGATEKTNGNLTMTVTAQSGGALNALGQPIGAASSPLAETVTMNFPGAGFSVADFYPATVSAVAATETITLSGGFTMSITDNGTLLTSTMTGTSFSTASLSSPASPTDGTDTMKNFNIVETEDANPCTVVIATDCMGDYSFKIVTLTTSIPALGGDVVITTPTTFRGTGANEPTVGVMVITGAGGSTLTLTANQLAGAPAGTAGPVNEVVDVDGAAGPTPPQIMPDTNWVAI